MGNRDIAKQGTHGREEVATDLTCLDDVASVTMYLLVQVVQIIWPFFYFYAHMRLGHIVRYVGVCVGMFTLQDIDELVAVFENGRGT